MSDPDRIEEVPVATDVHLHTLRWDGGDGVPFVLVHGLASNARVWSGVAGHLAAAGHPVLAVDQRGHGRSSKPDGPDAYAMSTVTDDLVALLEAAGFEQPVVAGQSWGGNVVVELAARFPGLVRAVAGIDGGAIDLAHRFPDWEACAEALRPPTLVGTPFGDIQSMIRGMHPDWPEEGIRATLACFEVREDGTVAPWLSLDRHLQVLRGLWQHRPAERIPLVAEPLLLVAAVPPDAGADASDDRRDALAAVAGPSTRIELVVGDHDLHAQHPIRIAELLRTLAE